MSLVLSVLRRALVRVCLATTPQEVCVLLVGATARPTTVLVRFWTWDSEQDLRLQASAGFPTGGGAYNRIDGEFSHISAGKGKIGHIAATGQPLIVRGIRGDEEWLANPGWISRQGVRTFIGLPLLVSDRVIGVLALFDRALPTDDAIDELRFIADVAAARLVDLASRDEQVPGGGDGKRVDRVLPVTAAPYAAPVVLTRDALRAHEKANIEAALAATHGKVFGDDGAARLLGMRPTTLASRIKALGVTRKRSSTIQARAR